MSEFPHDQFAKDYLSELLNTIGKATPNQIIRSERREGDVWFERDPKLSMVERRKRLGLIGQLLTHDSLIEVFRNPATEFEIRSCNGKLIDLEGHLLRQAERRKETVAAEKLPYLWFIMPTASETLRRGFGFQKARISGVYRLSKLHRVGLIVVHQLPITEETLLLRVLGKKGKQNRAIQELTETSPSSTLYASIEEILANYRTNLEASGTLTPDDEELIMNLSAAYLKKREEWKLEGKLEERLELATNLLREGSALDFIAKVTGLPIESIQELCDRQ
jgi:hypothetical protein